MSRRSRTGLAGNTMILTAGTVLQTIVALVTVPLYLAQLGDERFGAWVIAGVVIAYFGLLDRGLGAAVQNEVARLADGDAAVRSQIVWTAAALNAVVGLVAMLGVIAVGEILYAWVIDLPEGLQEESIAALPEFAASVPLIAVAAIFQGTLMARGRVATVSVLDTLRLLGLQLIPLLFVYWQGPDLRWLALGLVAALAMSTAAYLVACVALALRPSPWSRPSRVLVGRLFHFGKWITATSVLTPLLDFSDRVVIGAIRGTSAVTSYAVAYNVASRLTMIPYNVVRVTFPRFSALGAEDARTLGVTALAAVAAVTAPAAVIGAIASGPFFQWWLEDDVATSAAPVAAVLLAGFWINGLGYVPSTLLQAQGRPDSPARIHALEIAPFLVILAAGIYLGGPVGAAIAWSFRALVDLVLLMALSTLPWRNRTLIATGVLVVVAVACGVLASSTALLVVVGVPLVGFSLVGAWLLSPPEARVAIRRAARLSRDVESRPAGEDGVGSPPRRSI